jgi:hypothetical protein
VEGAAETERKRPKSGTMADASGRTIPLTTEHILSISVPA